MRLSGWKLPFDRLSATSLSTAIQCPEQFRQKYLLKSEEKMTGERFMGIVTHKALASLFENFEQSEGGDLVSSMATEEAWQETIVKEGEPEWYDVDATEQFRRTKQMIKNYWPIASQISPIAVEQRFEETIAGVQIQGYVDRELTDRILEVKTASQKVSKPKPRWSFQGRLYSLVSAKPIEWHVVTRQVTPKVYTAVEAPALMIEAYNPDVTVKIIEHAVSRINDYYARYGKDYPWPMDGIFGDWACDYCSFKKSCPAHLA